jgi:CheY-like chemotaxis protein
MLGPMQTAPHAAYTPALQVRPMPLRILVVDDCRLNRMLVNAILMRWGLVPTIACNGKQAVQLAETHDFDLVLMDILMPVMDGIVATAKIRQIEREKLSRLPVPIVAYTSLDLGSDGTQLARVGLSAVLAKPCNSTSMRLCLERWCPDKFGPGGH